MTPAVRLQRVIAEAGIASRRAAEALITSGQVRVDGRPAVLGERVDPASQRIEVNGRPLPAATPTRTLVLSKPRGVTSTVRDRHARRTVLDLVPLQLSAGARLYPVGRLDLDSEGLLLLTNDGGLAERLLHPRYGVEREYAVAVPDRLSAAQESDLRAEMRFPEGPAKLDRLRRAGAEETRQLAGLVSPPPGAALSWYRVVLTQGRKRQLRRMFAAVGAPIQRLVRVRIGPLILEGLASGEVRALRDDEVARLRAAVDGTGRDRANGAR